MKEQDKVEKLEKDIELLSKVGNAIIVKGNVDYIKSIKKDGITQIIVPPEDFAKATEILIEINRKRIDEKSYREAEEHIYSDKVGEYFEISNKGNISKTVKEANISSTEKFKNKAKAKTKTNNKSKDIAKGFKVGTAIGLAGATIIGGAVAVTIDKLGEKIADSITEDKIEKNSEYKETQSSNENQDNTYLDMALESLKEGIGESVGVEADKIKVYEYTKQLSSVSCDITIAVEIKGEIYSYVKSIENGPIAFETVIKDEIKNDNVREAISRIATIQRREAENDKDALKLFLEISENSEQGLYSMEEAVKIRENSKDNKGFEIGD